jgi:hypothetical protein
MRHRFIKKEYVDIELTSEEMHNLILNFVNRHKDIHIDKAKVKNMSLQVPTIGNDAIFNFTVEMETKNE